jgi:hypothetical protein
MHKYGETMKESEAVRDVGVMAGFMNFKASIFLLDSAQQLRDTF